MTRTKAERAMDRANAEAARVRAQEPVDLSALRRADERAAKSRRAVQMERDKGR